MYVPPVHPRATHASPQLRRTVVAVLALTGAVLATATVLARSDPVAPPVTIQVAGGFSHAASFVDRLASAADDTGPGCAESEVAKHPVSGQ
jgi:hypothetical protein